MYIGDVVIRCRSEASTLKRKVYRVEHIEGTGYAATFMCRDPFGKVHKFYEYQIIRIDRLLDNTRDELRIHDQNRVEIQNKIIKLENEMREVKKYFPTI